MVYDSINDSLGLNKPVVAQNPTLSVKPVVQKDERWYKRVEELICELKRSGDFGQVSDILFRIPVLINGEVEIWEYDTLAERDINMQNFQDHVVNISHSICKWNTASQIYNEIIEIKQLEYNNWAAKSMYVLRQQKMAVDKKLTEASIKELFVVENEPIDTKLKLELLYLKGTKSIIDNAIIKSLNEKSKHLVTIGLQYRQEYKGNVRIQE